MPHEYIPTAYKKLTDMLSTDTDLVDPKDWSKKFLGKMEKAWERGGRKRAKVIPGITDVVEERIRTRGGPEEVTGADLDAVVKAFRTRSRRGL